MHLGLSFEPLGEHKQVFIICQLVYPSVKRQPVEYIMLMAVEVYGIGHFTNGNVDFFTKE